jgi:glycosyltransferase involved in cell wall biosynthesis
LCGYNQAAYLNDAVASVLSQTHRDLELIIVDNGSTDGSQALLKQYESDPRVRLLLHPANGPVTVRLNDAIARSSGEFISILYADDYYLPNKIERQVEAFATLSPDYGVVYSPGYRVDDRTGARWLDRTLKRSGSVLQDMFDRHDAEGFINPISPLMRRECFERCPYHEDVFAEAETIFLRFALYFKFFYLDEPLSVMREHDLNIGKAIKVNISISLLLLDKLSKEPGFPRGLEAALTRFRGDRLGVFGWLALRMAADPKWARECFLSAIRLQPRQILRPRTLCGLALSVLPVPAIRVFNRAMNRMRTHKETIAFRTGYT